MHRTCRGYLYVSLWGRANVSLRAIESSSLKGQLFGKESQTNLIIVIHLGCGVVQLADQFVAQGVERLGNGIG